MSEEGREDDVSEERIYHIPVERILVPDVRVTSAFDAQVEEEFLASIRTHGVLEPIAVGLVGREGEAEQYVLIDGLHRVLACRRLGIQTIPARVRRCRIEDILVQNVISARQRGKENPADTAQVVRVLIDEHGMSMQQVQQILSLSESYIRKLYKVAQLPSEILTYVGEGKISVSAAYHLTNLTNLSDMLSVAEDAANWGYTEQQVKARVTQILNPDIEPEQQEYTFTPQGQPQRVLPRCVICEQEIAGVGKYVWMHDECHAQFIHMLQFSSSA